MTRTVVTFGDSWPQGAEMDLAHEKPYGCLLTEYLGFDQFINYGQSGTSNEQMIWQLREFIDTKRASCDRVIAIFHLTNPSRTSYFPEDFMWNVSNSEYARNSFFKDLFCHFYNNERELMRTNIALTTMQSWCHQHSIEDYYFSGWVKYKSWFPEVDVGKIWKAGQETAGDWFGAGNFIPEHLIDVQNNPYIKPNFAHPNQQGHELIAHKLAEWILNKR